MEEGSHQDLMNAGRVYADMVRAAVRLYPVETGQRFVSDLGVHHARLRPWVLWSAPPPRCDVMKIMKSHYAHIVLLGAGETPVGAKNNVILWLTLTLCIVCALQWAMQAEQEEQSHNVCSAPESWEAWEACNNAASSTNSIA